MNTMHAYEFASMRTHHLTAAAAYTRKRGRLLSPRIIPRALPPSATFSFSRCAPALAPLCFQWYSKPIVCNDGGLEAGRSEVKTRTRHMNASSLPRPSSSCCRPTFALYIPTASQKCTSGFCRVFVNKDFRLPRNLGKLSHSSVPQLSLSHNNHTQRTCSRN